MIIRGGITSSCGLATLVLFAFGYLCCSESPNKPNDGLSPMVFTDMEPDWSPDGSKIAYTSGGDGTGKVPSGLYIVEVATRERAFILQGANVYGPRWNPDGDWIAISVNQNIFKIKPNGDSLVQLAYGESEFDPSWSPDCRLIAFHRNQYPDGGVFVMTNQGDSVTQLHDEAIHPDWFPDGEKLSAVTWDSNKKPQITILPLSLSTVPLCQ